MAFSWTPMGSLDKCVRQNSPPPSSSINSISLWRDGAPFFWKIFPHVVSTFTLKHSAKVQNLIFNQLVWRGTIILQVLRWKQSWTEQEVIKENWQSHQRLYFWKPLCDALYFIMILTVANEPNKLWDAPPGAFLRKLIKSSLNISYHMPMLTFLHYWSY